MDATTVTVDSKCTKCGVIEKFEIPAAGQRLRRKGTSIKDAFPDLPIERQQQLVDHVCPLCRKQG